MLRKSLCGIFISVLLLAFFSSVTAQPRHKRLLHHVPLTSNTTNPIGEISAVGGQYSDMGWTPTNLKGQLRVDLQSFLPVEGTLEVTMTGLMPKVNNEWIPIALYSRGEGSFYDVDPSPGSYVFLKTDDHYAASGVDFKLFSAAFYGANEATKREDTSIPKRSWSSSKEYVFQLIWNRESVWILVDGEVLTYQPFVGQVESFGYIFLGSDNTYGSTITGVHYKDLKILVPNTDYPFSNIANPYNEMAHRKVGGQGVSITDVDANGEEDIYISNFIDAKHGVDNILYVQNNSSFNEESSSRGVNDSGFSTQSLFGDFDNDGDNDLFVVNFHRSPTYANEPNHLYINDGDGYYADFTGNLSGNTPYDSKGATILDAENDGDLDIVVINAASQHQFYINDGSANFTVQSRGLDKFRSSTKSYKTAASCDLNQDGFQDLIIVHDTGLSLAGNDGQGSFSSKGELSVPSAANSVSVADLDNDADLDLLVGAKSGENGRIEVFRNDGNFSFTNISSQQQLNINSYGALPGDWNNDGYIDIFAVDVNSTGQLYLNNGSGNLILKPDTGVEGIFASDGRGAATLDVNDDGRLDIYATSHGGFVLDEGSGAENPYNRNYLYRNDIVSGGNYLKIRVIDENDAVAGIGHKIYVYQSGQLDNSSGLIGFREIVSTNGFNSQSSLIQHFGVGSVSSVDVKIVLPDGSDKVYTNVPTNQTMTVSPIRIVPERMERDFDETQTAVAGQVYNMAYKLYSAEDEAVPDHPVTFEIIGGNGSLEINTNVTSKTVNTDQDGRAAISWVLGPLAGLDGINEIQVTSSYEGTAINGSPDNYSVIADADIPTEILITGGNAQMGFIDTELVDELVARVVDELGNGIPSHAVEFSVIQGGGTLKSGDNSGAQVIENTDTDGYARVGWIMGSQLGEQKVSARATFQGSDLTNSPLTFHATAQEPQRQLLYVSGDDQTAPINSPLSNPFVVRLLDSEGVPISDEGIKFVATSGGYFSGADSIFANTDSQGYARATATVGSVVGDSIYVYKAYADNAAGSPVTFKVSSISGPPTKIIYIDGNNQTAPAGRYLPIPLKVKLTDANDLPAKGYDVQFNITQGGGKVNGLQTATVKADAEGIASVRWKLGEAVGNNSLVATASGLNAPGINFKAEGVVGPPARISKYGGDNQKGEAGLPLAQYFVVSVTDSFYNAVVSHPVTFSVASGGGHLDGQTQVTELTNAFGQAQALLTLGPTAFDQTVEAASEYMGLPLIDSPQTFYATLGPGDPTVLVEKSGNHQIGAVNQPLPEPFVVRVQDNKGVGVSNIEVEFITFSQGASFSGSASIKVRTNDDGLAQATATLGSNFGNNNYVFEVHAKYNNKHLRGSPGQFYASGRKSLAKKIQKLNGNEIFSGTVGQFLGDSLNVLVLDENDQPVPNHPVTFQVQEGLALIAGQYTNHVVSSNNYGVASASIKLGTRPGESTIRALSDDGVNPLTPPFLDFQVHAETGAASSLTSSVSAESGLIANGQDVSSIEIVLLDQYKNPVIGKYVILQTAGIDVLVNQPSQPTDENGKTTGSISSINIGTVTIWALVENQPIVSTEINFIPGPPVLAMKLNDGQTGEKAKPLTQPVGLLVQDAYSHPIKNLQVTFNVERGKGSVLEPQPVLSNEEGKAMAHWTLGDSLGEQRLSAAIDGMITPLVFTAFAIPPSDGLVHVHSGDSLIAQANQLLPEPFRVLVTDKSGEPISSIPVEFQVMTQGGGVWSAASRVNTDQNGVASAQLKAGSQVGDHQVIATATNYGSVFFNFKIEEQRSVRIVKLSEEGQSVRPKTELPVMIKVVDGYNRPLDQEEITFVQVQGQSYIKEDLPIKTNSDGEITATWIMGTAGAQQMEIKPINAVTQTTYFAAVVVNSAPYFEPPLQKNHAVNAGNEVSFAVNATDPDGDAVYYMARNLPSDATFDKDDTHQFSWTPSTLQAGEHQITFVIMDDFGASDSTVVNIVVDIRNLPPDITAYSPPDTVKIIPFDSQQTFQVEAEDPNGDVLNFEWTVNSAFAGDTQVLPLVFTRETFPDSFAAVKVRVYDNYGGERSMTWRIHMQKITAVELSAFEALVENNSVRLEWQTSKEDGTAGFYILKSRREDGPFDRVNENIIKPQPDGRYSLLDEEVEAGQRYYYTLKEIDIYGMTARYGLVEAQIALPTELALAQNYPNPFNPRTTIRFELPAQHIVKIAIYNTTGQQVRMLVDGDYAAGIHQVVWDATNEQGIKVPSGIYYYRMRSDGFDETKKLLLLK